MQKEVRNFEFIGSLEFDFENLPNDGINYLLIFDDFCDETSRSKYFAKIAIARRHPKLNFMCIKHNFFHTSTNGRDNELQHTHMVLFQSPRDVQQNDVLGRQLGLGNTQRKWYADATSTRYGHLMIDLSPETNDLLRYYRCYFMVLFKSPRDVQQIDVLGKQLALGSTRRKWYADATSTPNGHLMFDSSPETNDL